MNHVILEPHRPTIFFSKIKHKEINFLFFFLSSFLCFHLSLILKRSFFVLNQKFLCFFEYFWLVSRESESRSSPSSVKVVGHLSMPQVLDSGSSRLVSCKSPSSPVRPSSSSPRATPIRMSSAAETLGAVGGGSGSGGPASASTPATGENEDAAWRNFCYEHPLHAATSAMLNLGGASALNEDSAVNSVGGILVSTYDHHYYPAAAAAAAAAASSKNQHHQHQSHQQHHSSINNLPPLPASVQPVIHKDGKSMNELWS